MAGLGFGQTSSQDWADEVLYFVIVDRFADGDLSNNIKVDLDGKGAFHGGDLRGLTQKLPYLSELGITALWITPLVKNIDDYTDAIGFPDWAYHGYWADDFTRLDPRFGTESDLRELIEKAHQRGIKVLLDVVYNHAGYGSHYIQDPATKAWLRYGSACGEDDLTSCIAGLPDFRTEDAQVRDYLINAQLHWAKSFDLDGFRLDTVKHVDHPFWSENRKRLREELQRPFFLVGEVWGGSYQVCDPWFERDEMDAGFDFTFAGNVISFVQGRGRTIAFSRYLQKRHQIRAGYQMAHYLSSHDVPGAFYQLKGDKKRFQMCVALQLSTLGIPVIYYGEEVARIGGDWPDNRSDMPWGDNQTLPGKALPQDTDMFDFYRHWIALRKAHPALMVGTYRELSTDGDVLVFERQDPESGERVWVAANRSGLETTVMVPAQDGISALEDGLNGDRPSLTETGWSLTLAPLQVRVFVTERKP
ncbi:MAG: alpha-amylase [Acidobacteria bacterium]|nr:alpha-amylase [Acidobacteriota bacterium]